MMIQSRKRTPRENGIKKKAIPLSDDHRYSETTFVVHIGGRKLELQPHKFLEACWADGFDTPCSVCNAQFDVAKAPPVRTIRLNGDLRNIPPLTKALPPLVILNTHLECLKLNGIKYIPISHAWHQPVADAYASRVSNTAAARMVYEIPARTILAAAQRFGPDVQIWHDYISIPQWQDSFRGTIILPQIFQIFKHGDCSIIHLDDEPAIQTLETYTPEHFAAQSSSLQHLFSARWFNRMWVVIEYDVSRDAYLLNSNYEITLDTFSSLTGQIVDCHISCLTDNLVHPASPIGSALKWIETVPMFVKERLKNKCLGHIYDMIGNQGCRDYRDRFIASCALLEVDDYSRILSELPQDPQEACLWVSKRCLEGNDFSPLLLCPSGEPQYDEAHWLKGHTVMASNMWGLSIQTQAAQVTPRVQGNRVSLELELVGTVMKYSSWGMRGVDNYFGFVEVLPHIVELAAGSVSRFLDYLERIYPSEFLWIQRENTYDFPGIRYRVPSLVDIEKRLQNLLKQYSEANRRDDSIKCKILCDGIVSTLALSEPPSSGFGLFGSFCLGQREQPVCSGSEHEFRHTKKLREEQSASETHPPGQRLQLESHDGFPVTHSPPESGGDIVRSMKRKHGSTEMSEDESAEGKLKLTKRNGSDDGGDGNGDSDTTASSSRLTLNSVSQESNPCKAMADLAVADPPISRHQILPDNQLPDNVRRLRQGIVRYSRDTGVIPMGLGSQIKGILRDNPPPERFFDSGTYYLENQQKIEKSLLQGILKIHKSARECGEGGKPSPSWGEEVTRPLLELASDYWRKKRKPDGSDICIENIATASISMPQLLPRDDQRKRYTPKGTNYGMYLKCRNRVIERLRLLWPEERTINQSLDVYLYDKPQVMVVGLATHRDPLIQLAIWSSALLNRLRLLAPSNAIKDLPPVVALQVVRHQWDIYMSTATRQELRYKLYGPENIGSTLMIEDIFQIVRVLGTIADYAADEYWPWLDKNIPPLDLLKD
ncbi:MAG: hypothetical protein M1839_001456 [Geoglossum umbratile]|nr:MAG: hypothetical protein M1839_001456 [Geoglossum umbratile]